VPPFHLPPRPWAEGGIDRVMASRRPVPCSAALPVRPERKVAVASPFCLEEGVRLRPGPVFRPDLASRNHRPRGTRLSANTRFRLGPVTACRPAASGVGECDTATERVCLFNARHVSCVRIDRYACRVRKSSVPGRCSLNARSSPMALNHEQHSHVLPARTGNFDGRRKTIHQKAC